MEDLILRGPPCKLPEIQSSIGEYFFEKAQKISNSVFQIDGDTGKQETYNDVKRRSVRLAIYLQNLGVKQGDKILLCCRNNLDNFIPALAAMYLGAPVASVDHVQAVPEVKNSLILLEPILVVVDKDGLDLIEKSLQEAKQTPHIIVIGGTEGKYPNMWNIEENGQGEDDFRPTKLKGSDIATIIFSSGTTSVPKGICLTHWGLLNGERIFQQNNCSKSGVSLHLTSLIWVSAWYITVDCIVTGTAKVILPKVEAEQLLKLIEKHKITLIMCSTTYTYGITNLAEATVKKYDTSSLYSLLVGGSTINPQQILKVRKYLPHTNVSLIYASTETGMLTLPDYVNQKEALKKVASSGIVVRDVEMKFVDQDTGNSLGPNQRGEIRIKSKYTMAGYYNLPNSDIYADDGFLKVGDVGYYDDDGYVYVTDRISEMFKCRGYYISPGVLESVLQKHPAVEIAVVFGIPHEVDMTHAAACVVLKPGASVTSEELIEFVKPQVSDAYQLRGGIAIVESIPKTPSGKYQRRKIKELFEKKNSKLNNEKIFLI